MSDSRSATTNISHMTRHLSRSLKYAGKDLGTMLEVGPEEDEEAAPDEETLATEECKRSHSRFTACENSALCGLLSARGHVPAKRKFIEWVKRRDRDVCGQDSCKHPINTSSSGSETRANDQGVGVVAADLRLKRQRCVSFVAFARSERNGHRVR